MAAAVSFLPCFLSGIGYRTLHRRVLAKVLGLVSAEETLGLDLGGSTSGELLVEGNDALHANSIRSGANRLYHHSSAANSIIITIHPIPSSDRRIPKTIPKNNSQHSEHRQSDNGRGVYRVRTLGEATCFHDVSNGSNRSNGDR